MLRTLAVHCVFLGLAVPVCLETTGHCQDTCEQTLRSEKPQPAPDKLLCLDEPADINEVLIGYFGPTDPCAPQGIDMWRAAGWAIEQANLAGGYKGLPFRLVPGWSNDPWGSGVKQVVRMAYLDKVWAIIGGIDGPTTHLAEQVVAKARLTLLSPANTDRTANLANVPWMFSCLPPDSLQAPPLAASIAARVRHKPFVLVSAVDHDSQLFAIELSKSLRRRQITPAYHFQFKPDERNLADLAEKVINIQPEAVVLIADSQQSARLTSIMRKRGLQTPIFGGPCMGQRRFAQEAGKNADGTIFPLLFLPGENSEDFERTFTARFGNRPDYLAAHTYDAVNLMTTAIRKAGLDRTAIRDAVTALTEWHGVAGPILWDSKGSNSRAVPLGTIDAGRLCPLGPADNTAESFNASE